MRNNYNHRNKNGWSNNQNKPRQENQKQRKQVRQANRPFAILQEDKKVYGAYYNMALDNFCKTVAYIFNGIGIKQFVRNNFKGEYVEVPMYSEENLHIVLNYLFKYFGGVLTVSDVKQKIKKLCRLSSKDEEQEKIFNEDLEELGRSIQLTNEQRVRFQQMLFRHFPFLGPIMADYASYSIYKQASENSTDKNEIQQRKKNIMSSYESLRGVSLSQCLEELSKMGECLASCRNQYTHFKPFNSMKKQTSQLAAQYTMAKKLDKILTAARRLTKQNIAITTEEMEFITGIDHYSNINREFIERENYYFNPKGKAVASEEVRDTNGVISINSSTHDALSPFGIVFFCVMFLPKTYARLFIDETRLFNGSPFSEEENSIMREIMSLYRIRTPRGKRLDSQATDITLGMDILNELRKCPIELYDTLSEQGRRFFEDKVVHTNYHTPETVKRLRNTDRFPHLAMRYIDETNKFDEIRFQVRLGSFRFRFYNKKDCVDGIERVRRIQKDVNGFGRLQEIETERQTRWEKQMQSTEYKEVKLEHEDLFLDLRQFPKDSSLSTPYITDRRADYNIHNNRIGLYWNIVNSEEHYLDDSKCFLPELKTSGEGDKRRAVLTQPSPLCTLSVRELPALLFYQYLCDNYESKSGQAYPSAETLIKRKYESLVKFFNAIKNGTFPLKATEEETEAYLKKKYKLSLADIPDKLRDYLTGKQVKPMQHLIDLTFGYVNEKGEYVKGKLELRREKLEKRIKTYQEDRKKIGDKQNSYGKKNFVDVRLGALAKYLVRDIVSWQPSVEEGRDKMTGLNYTVMQAFLATYGTPQTQTEGTKTVTITQLFDNAKLLSGPTVHPFLTKVLNLGAKNIEKFYLDYLKEEVKYIESLEKKVKMGKSKENILRSIPFVHPDRVRYADRSSLGEIRKQADRYLSVSDKDSEGEPVCHRASIMLPDTMFVNHINHILREQFSDNKEFCQLISYHKDESAKTGIRKDELKNSAFSITKYFEMILGDKSQIFYYSEDTVGGDGNGKRFARNYKLFQTLYGRKSGPGNLPYYLSPNQINTKVSERIFPLQMIEITGDGIPRYKKKIQTDIEKYKSRNRQVSDEDARIALKHQLKDCKENEKTIRRYKTQDMVLFLMTKDLLSQYIRDEETQEENSLFMLKNVCDEHFLRRTVRYEFPVKVNDNRTVKVVQPNMSLKNYGEFYRLLSDDRFMNMIEQLKDINEYNYNKLMAELNSYDAKRSLVFGLVHRLEEIIYGANAIIHDENQHEKGFHVEDDANKDSRRNNFRSMLYIYDKDSEKSKSNNLFELLISIRNAFGHNHLRIPFRGWMTDEEAEKFKQWISKDDEMREKGHERIAPPSIAERILARTEKMAEETGIIKLEDKK